MPFANPSAANVAHRYALDVIKGRIPSGRFTKLACQRHLNDLKREDFKYHYDPEEASRVCSIIELFPHTKGKWAAAKELIVLQPWQKFLFCVLFGWLRKDGTRRFRHAYLAVARKNGKSIIAAALGLYMLGFDGETGAEVYCGATSEKQAWEVFKPARLMVLKTPDMQERVGIEPLARSLVLPEDGSKFEPIIGDPGDGSSPSLGIVDEYHEHKTPVQYDTLVSGMGARDNPLMVVITTAGAMHGGPCFEHQRQIERVLEGTLDDDEQFGLIYHADLEDDWSEPAVLEKANPGIGVSISRDYLESRQRDAVQSSIRQNLFKTKHLNLWVTAKQAAFNMDKWQKCINPTLKLEDFEGKPCVIAIDLASKSDIAAVVKVFWEDIKGVRHYTVFPKFYLPEDRIHEDKTGRYQAWMSEGILTATDGNEIDFGVIGEDIEEDMGRFEVIELPYDPWRATQLAQGLTQAGATMVEYRNTVAQMSEPMKELDAAIGSLRFHFDGNPALSWMASNTVSKVDANQNVFPRKENAENKIDGIVSIIMGIGRLIYREENEANVYEERGLRAL